MDMNYVLGILGIAISILTFAFGYRKTIGARNEIVRAANESLVSLLTKHFVTSKAHLSRSEIEMIRSGQAISRGVDIARLRTIPSLKDQIALKIFDNEYLNDEEKRHALDRVNESFSNSESNLLDDINSHRARRKSTKFTMAARGDTQIGSLLILGVSSTLVPVLLYILLADRTSNGVSVLEFLDAPLLSIIVITSLLMVIFTYLRRNVDQDERSVSDLTSLLNSHISDFTSVLSAAGEVEDVSPQADFVLTLKNGKKVLIECRFDVFKKSDKLLDESADKLEKAREIHVTDYAMLVVAPELHPVALDRFKGRQFDTVSLFDTSRYLDGISV